MFWSIKLQYCTKMAAQLCELISSTVNVLTRELETKDSGRRKTKLADVQMLNFACTLEA